MRYGDAMRLYIVCPTIYGYKSHELDSRDYFFVIIVILIINVMLKLLR